MAGSIEVSYAVTMWPEALCMSASQWMSFIVSGSKIVPKGPSPFP